MELNLRKLNKEIEGSKFSKTELALKCGIDRKTIENVLAGRDPKLSTVISLASMLGVKISYLFDEEGDVRTAARDYVEKGKIEHHGTEYNGNSIEADLRDQIAILKSQLADKERIIHLMENQTK